MSTPRWTSELVRSIVSFVRCNCVYFSTLFIHKVYLKPYVPTKCSEEEIGQGLGLKGTKAVFNRFAESSA
jgi:hypothetical protein